MSEPLTETPERIDIVDNEDDRYFELRVDDAFAGLIVYESIGGRRVLTHTFVEEAYRGRGLGELMIGEVLDRLRAKGTTVSSLCPMVDRFVESHPEYADLVDLGAKVHVDDGSP